MAVWGVFVVASGTLLMVAGTYRSVVGIVDSCPKNGGCKAWSCADDSNSVQLAEKTDYLLFVAKRSMPL
jgi:hypothetical protein